MRTDLSESGLEDLIVAAMTGRPTASAGGGFAEAPEPFVGLHDWRLGDPKSYDRAWTVDLAQLRAFVAATQPPMLAALDLDRDGPTRQKVLARLQARSAGAASSRCSGTGSSTARTRWRCSTTRPPPATSRPLSSSR